jgi:hypothetical protein
LTLRMIMPQSAMTKWRRQERHAREKRQGLTRAPACESNSSARLLIN